MGVILSFPPGKRVIDVRREIRSRVERGDFKSFVYIVPTRRKIRELQREFLSYAPGNVAPEFNFFIYQSDVFKFYPIFPFLNFVNLFQQILWINPILF